MWNNMCDGISFQIARPEVPMREGQTGGYPSTSANAPGMSKPAQEGMPV